MAVHLACQRHVGSKRMRGEVKSGLTCMQISWRLLCADPLRVLRAIRLGARFGFSLTCRGSEWALCADPLRVLRAIRFGARFGFRLDEELEHAAASEPVRHPACLHLTNASRTVSGPLARPSHGLDQADSRHAASFSRGPRAVHSKLLLWSSVMSLLPFWASSMPSQRNATLQIPGKAARPGCLRLPQRSLRP